MFYLFKQNSIKLYFHFYRNIINNMCNCFLTLQTVIVGDDCALPPPRGIAGRRGLAGTILVNKVLSLSLALLPLKYARKKIEFLWHLPSPGI